MLRKLSEGERRTIAHWAMEFVVVVVGVLLALWLQERVSQADKARDASAAEAAVHDEIDDNLMILVAHDVVSECRRERLDEIESRLERDGPAEPIVTHWGITGMNGVPSKHRPVYGFFGMDVTDTAWQAAIASGSVSAMKPERFRSIAAIYATFDMIRQTLATDRDAANTLQALAYRTNLTPELRASLIKAFYIASANRKSLSEPLSARALAAQVRALGWNDVERMDARIRDFKAGVKAYALELKPCARPVVNPFA